MPQLDFSTASSGPSRKISVFDPEMPTLPEVFDTDRLRNDLPPHLLSLFPGECSSVGRINLQVLQWQPGRRLVLEIALKTTTGWLRFVGKVYCEDRPDVFEAMKKIWHSGLNGEAQFSIPRPVAYMPSLRLLLQEKVEGTLAKRLFLDGNPIRHADAAERCALWLARFQALAPQQGKIMDVQRILKHSERRLRFFVDAGMPFGDKAERLFQRLSDTSSYLEKKPMCAGHGDYTHNQVILSEKAAVTFDWDGYEVADPCRDCLERLALKELRSARGLGDASRIFLTTYLAGTPGVESHLPFYRAAICLQGARRDLVSHDLGRLERAEILLDRGLQVLES